MKIKQNANQDHASRLIGRMLDFAVHSLHMKADEFMDLFIASGTAALFERGDIRITCGMSGIELAYEVLERSGIETERIRTRYTTGESSEYWCGAAICIAQQISGVSFSTIMDQCSVSGMIAEFDDKKKELLSSLPWNIDESSRRSAVLDAGLEFCEETAVLIADQLTKPGSETRLRHYRRKSGLSQSQLAAESGIPVRTIQQYEQRQKDINKAALESIIKLAAALSCEPELLFETNSK